MGSRWAMAGLLALHVAALPAPIYAKERARERVLAREVVRTDGGDYVVLLESVRAPLRYLPIFIGEAEAITLRLRLDRQTPPRPLTLNLLESIMGQAKVQVVDISIDQVRGGVFLGSVRVRQSGRTWVSDARPSDAIGLALGSDKPIWVAAGVLEDAGVRIERRRHGAPSAGEDDGSPPAPPPPVRATDYYEDSL